MTTPYKPVTRRELRSMPAADQRRFVLALTQMTVSPYGPGTSVFARMALTHALHCVHAQETFPGWHRAYLCAFEAALQEADRQLGNDGRIGLPYWDFCDIDRPEVTPAIIREYWGEVPQGGPGGSLVPPVAPEDIDMPAKVRSALTARLQQLRRIGFSELNTDKAIAEYIKTARVAAEVDDALDAPEHWKFASKRYPRSPSIEAPHDTVHMAIGRPLSDLYLAGFHPLFWLLHANVDRLTSAYIAIHGPVVIEHFKLNQAFLAQRGEKDRYAQPLFPFNSPISGKPFLCQESFDTAALGYVYDKLPAAPRRRLREPPVLAVFPNIPVMPLEGKSYTLHVFAQPDGEPFYIPAGLPQQWKDHPNYVGLGSVFGTRGAACENCLDRKPWTLRIDITQGMKRLHLDADTADLYVFAEDEQGVVMPILQTPIPPVQIHGALGTTGAASVGLHRGAGGRRVARLQRMLRVLGVTDKDDAALSDDGDFGPLTLSALEKFQRLNGVGQSGSVTPETLTLLNRARIDGHAAESACVSIALPRGKVHVVAFEHLLPTLQTTDALPVTQAAVKRCLDAWAAVTGLRFEAKYGAEHSPGASVVVAFGDTADGAVRIPTDGPGGTLATTTVDGDRRVISFDEDETWVPTAATARGNGLDASDPLVLVDFEAVFMHEFGHALGIPHTHGVSDVMSTYYVPGRVNLTANDLAAVRKLYA